MDYLIHKINGIKIAEVTSKDILIKAPEDILYIIANLPARILILKKEMFHESFFNLKSGLAGEILQKCSNYFIKLAIIGDFSIYNSKSLNDFIYESNKTKQILFVDKIDEAIKIFSK